MHLHNKKTEVSTMICSKLDILKTLVNGPSAKPLLQVKISLHKCAQDPEFNPGHLVPSLLQPHISSFIKECNKTMIESHQLPSLLTNHFWFLFCSDIFVTAPITYIIANLSSLIELYKFPSRLSVFHPLLFFGLIN